MIKPIKTKKDYEGALERIEKLFDAEPDTPQGDELEVLITLVSAYEEENHAIDAPDPIAAIQHVMEANGMENKDMTPFFGSASKVSEVMNKKRRLSLSMIRNIHTGLNIPAGVLLGEYDLHHNAGRQV